MTIAIINLGEIYQSLPSNGGNCARIDTPWNLAVFRVLWTLGANSPITTPTTIAMNTNGVSSRSRMLNSLNGLDDDGASSTIVEPRLEGVFEILNEENVRVMSTAVSFMIGFSGTATFSSHLGSSMFLLRSKAKGALQFGLNFEFQNEIQSQRYNVIHTTRRLSNFVKSWGKKPVKKEGLVFAL